MSVEVTSGRKIKEWLIPPAVVKVQVVEVRIGMWGKEVRRFTEKVIF